MARTEITVTEVPREGVEAAQVAQVASTADGHFIAVNDGRVELEIQNTSGSVQTVEIPPNPAPGGTFDGLAIEPLVLTIPAGETWKFAQFRTYTFQQDSSGMMHLDPSVVTDLKFRAYRYPNP